MKVAHYLFASRRVESMPCLEENASKYAVSSWTCGEATKSDFTRSKKKLQPTASQPPVSPHMCPGLEDSPRLFPKLPWSDMHREIRSICAREQLLPHRAQVNTTSAMLLCRRLAAHPPQMVAHLVHGLLQLTA